MPEFTIDLDNDTHNYLEFLERMRFIKSKDEAVKKALLLFKKLSMHDWLPDIYRIADARIILMDRGMLLDVFELLTEDEIYRAGHLTALKRKVQVRIAGVIFRDHLYFHRLNMVYEQVF